MKNEILPIIPPVQPLPQIPPIVPTSTNWLKILLYTVLGLIIVAGSILIGIQIGKNQVPKQKTITAATPIPTTTNPISSNFDTTNYALKSPCQIVMGNFSDSNSNHDLDLSIEESTQNKKCKLVNNGVGYSLNFDNDWKVFPSGAISSPAIGFTKGGNPNLNKEPLYTLIINRDIANDKTAMDITNAEKTIITGEGGTSTLITKFQDVVEKKVIKVGNYQILDLTTTFSNVQKTDKNTDYTKTYILFDKPNGFVYEFILNSNKSTFDNPESVEMITATKEIIASLELK